MHINSWITGIYLNQYTTDQPNGALIGFDADYGDMYALNGKLVSLFEYKQAMKSNKLLPKPSIKPI